VQYAERDEYEFADTVFRLTKGGYLNATSTGWIPLAYTAANDRARPGGLNFSRVELLEISQVPVPALPTALVSARAAGIDTGPMFRWAEQMLDSGGFAMIPRADLEQLRNEARMPSPAHKRAANSSDWKCAASDSLAINHTADWDGAAAADRMIEAATADGKIDSGRAAMGFLLYDVGNPDEKGSYKEPFADIVDGKLVAVASGVRAAATRLPDVKDVAEEATKQARAILDAYEAQMTKDADDAARAFAAKIRTTAKDFRTRGLYELSMLCDLLGYADYVCCRMEQEASDEQDGSPNPARMRAWVDEGNRIIAAVAAEETAENIQGTQDPADIERKVARAVRTALSGLGLIREGKRLSKASRDKVKEAHGHATSAVNTLNGLLTDDNSDGDDPENPDDSEDVDTDDARARRARKAAARQRRLGATS